VGPHFSETIVPRIELLIHILSSLKRTDGNEVNALPPRDASGLPRLGQARARTQTQQTHFCCQGNWPKPFVSNPTFRIVLPCLCFFQLTAPCRESSGISSVHHFFERIFQLPTVEGRRLPNLTTPRFKQTIQCSCLHFASIVA
jgi:hypothetical protein